MMSIANKMRVLEMLDNSGTKTLVECFFFFLMLMNPQFVQ